MSGNIEHTLEGGCLCGAIRYRVESGKTISDYCHCRNCQRSTGSPVFANSGVALTQFRYTKGAPAGFRSSNTATREFCDRCGAQLAFRRDGAGRMAFTIATVDKPDELVPTLHIWHASRISWFETTDACPRFLEGPAGPTESPVVPSAVEPHGSAIALEGGCLCGAVRYRVEAGEIDSAYCHCRMCQRATGAPAVPWFTVDGSRFSYTSGKPRIYRSSSKAVREFCGTCGTPLVFRPDDDPRVDVTNATLDDTAAVPPRYHIWRMSRISWFETTDSLPRYDDRGADV